MKPEKRVAKDGTVSYILRVFVGRDDNGKQIKESKKWTPEKKYTEKQLEKELNRQLTLFEDEVKCKYVNCNYHGITVEEFSKLWIENFVATNLKKSTLASYNGKLKRINRVLGKRKLQEVTPLMVSSFLADLKKPGSREDDAHLSKEKRAANKNRGLSDKTVKNYYGVFSSMFNTAKMWDAIDKNPMDGVKTPKVQRKKVKALKLEEVERLFVCLEKAPLQYQLFIKLGIFSGCRKGEMLGLKWTDIDFEHQLIRIEDNLLYAYGEGTYEDTPKSESSKKVIKLSKVILDLFQALKDEQQIIKDKLGDQYIDKNYVFTTWNGNYMHPATPYKWFRYFQEKNGLPHTSIHQLRHTTATTLIMEAHANVAEVSARLGHSDTSTTTNIYVSYFQEADARLSDTLDDIFTFDNKKEDEENNKDE